MKKYLIAASNFLLPLAALAHGMETEVEEESSFGHQMEGFMPFSQVGEEHYFAAVLSIILWASFVYAIYSLIKNFKKTP